MARKAPSKWTMFGTISGFLIGVVFGSGSIWQWRQHQLDKIVKTAELRKQENDLYAKIIELSADYGKNQDRHDKRPNDTEAANNMYQLKARLDVLKDDFSALENSLAYLEGRNPRSITLEFIPPHAVTNVQVTVH